LQLQRRLSKAEKQSSNRHCKPSRAKSRIAIATANQQREKQRCNRCSKSLKAKSNVATATASHQ